MSRIEEEINKRILVLDGAMGTMIQRHKLEEQDFRKGWFENHNCPLKGNNDLLSLTRPEIIKDIHDQYFEAGADIVETNTFSGTSIAQADYNLESAVVDINYHSAKIARASADEYSQKEPDKPRFVAGSIGPTNRTASLSPDVNSRIQGSYVRRAYQAYRGGWSATKSVDGNGERFSLLNAKAALFAIEEVFNNLSVRLPIMNRNNNRCLGSNLKWPFTKPFFFG